MDFNKLRDDLEAKFSELKANLDKSGEDISDNAKELRKRIEESLAESKEHAETYREMAEDKLTEWNNTVSQNIRSLQSEIEDKKEEMDEDNNM